MTLTDDGIALKLDLRLGHDEQSSKFQRGKGKEVVGGHIPMSFI